jgi:uncharacterized membrane protein (UPF0127 family)
MIPRILLCLLILTGAANAAETGSVTIETAKGPQRFAVELATTPDQMALGLMYRESLPEDAGMLFVYPSTQPVAFWMKNTLIPLDMLFIGPDGHIRRIAERTVPLSTIPVPSVDPVRAVLEINGGLAEKLGIKTGDMVKSAALGTGG